MSTDSLMGKSLASKIPACSLMSKYLACINYALFVFAHHFFLLHSIDILSYTADEGAAYIIG